MYIRLIDVALDNVDVIFDEVKPGSIENHKVIPKKLLLTFLNDWLDFVARILAEKNSRPDDKNFDREVTIKLGRYGTTLQTLLFPPVLNFTDAQELVFSVDADWVRLPFELLPMNRATENFAGLQIPVLRQIRTVQKASPATETKKAELSFLLLANTEGGVDISSMIEKEKKSLQDISGDTADFRTLGKFARSAQVVEELTHCKHLHYAGHIREQSIRLNDGVLNSQDVAAMGLGNIELAFVNGCNSAGEHGQNGLAAAFLSAGVKNYIGHNYPVSDAAALFAAEVVWGNFLRRKNTSLIGTFFYRHRTKALAEIALSLRRAIFEKFGAAELAWLGIQFFISTTEREQGKYGRFITIAAALVVTVVIAIFVIVDRVPGPAKNLLKAAPPPIDKPPIQPRSKKSATAARTEVPTKPLQEKPTIITPYPRRDAIRLRVTEDRGEGATVLKPLTIQSPVLANLVADFRELSHPYYTKEDKERILSEVLRMDVPESAKIIRLRNEMP